MMGTAEAPTSFDALYRRHSGDALRLARSITRNPHDASDAVAEAFSKVLQALSAGRLSEPDDLGPYVMAATRNAAFDILRRAGRLQPDGADGATDAPEASAGPSERLVAGEDKALVAQAFAELPPRWRAVLWLTEVESLPPRDAASLLRLSPNNVAQLAVRARSRLRERYVQVHVRNHARGACLDAVEQLGRFAAGQLPPARAAAVQAHLDGCAECRSRLAELDDLGLHIRRAVVPLGLLARPLKGQGWWRRLLGWRGSAARMAAEAGELPPGGLQQLVGSPTVQQLVGVVSAGLLVAGVGGIVARSNDRPASPEPVATAAPVAAPPASVVAAAPPGLAAPEPVIVPADPPVTTTTAAAPAPAAPSRAQVPAAPSFARLSGAVTSTVAHAIGPEVPVYDAPGAATGARALTNPQRSGAPLVLLVTRADPQWLQVLLPVRPNGSTGWVRRDDVTLSTHNFRVTVELGAHRITVFQGADAILSEPVAVGTSDAPTPGGLYYTTELIQPLDAAGRYDPGGPYGPFAYGLSGFSDVLFDFAGGDGQFGIHGTNDPSKLGSDVSHGCIRMSNAGITALAGVLPLGVPVEVVA